MNSEWQCGSIIYSDMKGISRMTRKEKRVVGCIEARMGSSRLPGKMALELYRGLPALGAVIERLSACPVLDGIIVATTGTSDDDLIVDIAKKFGASYFKGSVDDVLGRVVGAGEGMKADALVLVTGDCSCISPSLIDEGVDFFLAHSYDLVSNCLEDVYPIGIDLQIVRLEALKKAHTMACREEHRNNRNNFEHTNYFIRNHPDLFSLYRYPAKERHQRPDIQLALDTEADLKVISGIYARLYPKKKLFDLDDILDLLDKEPELLHPLKGANVNRTGIQNA